jgi:radical SAM superfamily enzyme YgiQ (UPF0313 family)
VLPSNTLACLRTLTLEFADSWKKEKEISITVEAYDEMVERIPLKHLADLNRGDSRVVAALVGVQSNQFARASDLAKQLTGLGVKTLIGGFHVSGVLTMFGEPTPEIRELMDAGVTIVHGEAEDRWESILAEVVEGNEKPLYVMDSYPDISRRPTPQPDPRYMKKFALPFMGTVDCSRGCPFNCTFCTVVNVQGHRMRNRSAEKVLAAIRDNVSHGIMEYFFTDDNFSRNPDWEKILDGIIKMREEEGFTISMMMQVDTRSHKVKNFVEKAGRAGCTQVFIGMESLNPLNIEAAGKKQNNVEDYAAFIDAWHKVGVMTHVGYIIGFPFDTPESVREDIRRLKEEVKVDQASFFMLTPLPGSRDHCDMVKEGRRMDSDLNRYDSFHIVMDHPRMSSEEWVSAYNEAWESFYSPENMRNILMRAGSDRYWGVFKNFMWYRNSLLEPRHPMVAGFVRLKNRREVRPGTVVPGFWKFQAQRIREMVGGFQRRVGLFLELQELWFLTRKPEDPNFRFVADFATAVNDAKKRISSLNIHLPSVKWREELQATWQAMRDKALSQYDYANLNRKARKRIDEIFEEMNTIIANEQYTKSVAAITAYLNKKVQSVENFTLKQVARRRKLTSYWQLSLNRIREGKILHFLLSSPKLVINGVKDIRLSAVFLYNLFNSGLVHHK